MPNKVNTLKLSYYNIECLEKQKSILGENHPDTLSTMNNLAVSIEIKQNLKQQRYNTNNIYSEMKFLSRESYPDTLRTMYNLVKHYKSSR